MFCYGSISEDVRRTYMRVCAELFMVKVLLWGSKQNGLCWQVGFEPYLIKEENKYSQFVLDQAAYQQCTHYFSFYSGCVGQKLDKYQILIGSVFMGFSTYVPHLVICPTSKGLPMESSPDFPSCHHKVSLRGWRRADLQLVDARSCSDVPFLLPRERGPKWGTQQKSSYPDRPLSVVPAIFLCLQAWGVSHSPALVATEP